jgi:hypothetical protein
MKLTWVTNITEEYADGYAKENKGMLVSEPQATPLHGVEDLKSLGMVGIYRVKDETLPEQHITLPEVVICSDVES